MQRVLCKNDNPAYLHVLILSSNSYFYFISGLYFDNLLKYFIGTLNDHTLLVSGA